MKCIAFTHSIGFDNFFIIPFGFILSSSILISCYIMKRPFWHASMTVTASCANLILTHLADIWGLWTIHYTLTICHLLWIILTCLIRFNLSQESFPRMVWTFLVVKMKYSLWFIFSFDCYVPLFWRLALCCLCTMSVGIFAGLFRTLFFYYSIVAVVWRC